MGARWNNVGIKRGIGGIGVMWGKGIDGLCGSILRCMEEESTSRRSERMNACGDGRKGEE